MSGKESFTDPEIDSPSQEEEAEPTPEELITVLKDAFLEAIENASEEDREHLMTEISGTGILVPSQEGGEPTLAPLDGEKVRFDLSRGLEPIVDKLFEIYRQELETGSREPMEIVTDIVNLVENLGQDSGLIFTKLAELGLLE